MSSAAGTAVAHNDKMVALIAKVLCCPDCRAQLNASLTCTGCSRTLTPESDGVISALPAPLHNVSRSKEEIQEQIEHSQGPNADSVVLYERAFHDEQAAHYDSVFADPLPVRSYYNHLVLRQIRPLVRKHPFVVDLCCGTGKSSLPLVQHGMPCVAIDVSREMLRAYKRKCDKYGLRNVVFIHADASRPPLRDGSCSAIMMIGGLHHIPEQSECVNICGKSLAPNGVLVLHEPLKTGRKSTLSVVLENLYAATDLPRVWAAVRRRLGGLPPRPATAEAGAVGDFTPYERPFSSAGELLAIMPCALQPMLIRSQGALSFREFGHNLQNRAGALLAPFVVGLDSILSRTGVVKWSGDALFAVFRKSG